MIGMLIPFDPVEHRRYSLDEITSLVRERYAVEIVDGFQRPLEEESQAEHQTWPIASFRHIAEAWKVDHDRNNKFCWLTGVVPEDAGDRDRVFVFPMATGYGVGYPEPSGWFELLINGQPAISFCETKYSQLWQQGDVALYFDVRRSHTAPEGTGLFLDPWISGGRMASFGAAILRVPAAYAQSGESAHLQIVAKQYFPSHTWVRVDQGFREKLGDDSSLVALTWEEGLREVLAGRQPLSVSTGHVFFGDIHTHSSCGVESPCGSWDKQSRETCIHCELAGRGTGCGYGTVNANYKYARDVANLDFYTLSEHDFQMPGNLWQRRLEIANHYNQPDRFAVIHGYEHTSRQYGHRNVYFRGDQPQVFAASPTLGGYGREPQVPPEDLWDYLEQQENEFITVPHHPTAANHPFCWERLNPKYDINVEIFSGWGSSETASGTLVGHGSNKYRHLTISRALQNGHRFGFVSGSDSHDGCPGNAQGSAIFNWANKFSVAGSGKTAVICPSLTRQHVFDAMKQRRCYATTGAPILIDLHINGQPMGSDIHDHTTREVRCSIDAPAEIDRVVVVKNGTALQTYAGYGLQHDISLSDQKTSDGDWYYVKVILKDLETAWSSPIFVRGMSR